jgi:hypothetical protein
VQKVKLPSIPNLMRLLASTYQSHWIFVSLSTPIDRFAKTDPARQEVVFHFAAISPLTLKIYDLGQQCDSKGSARMATVRDSSPVGTCEMK